MLLLLLLAASTLPVASAQVGEPIELLTDGTDDVTLFAPAAGVGTTSPRNAALDVTRLLYEETEDELLFYLEVQELAPQGEAPITDDVVHYIRFSHHDQAFIVQINRIQADQLYVWGNLLHFDPDNFGFSWIGNVQVDADTNTNTFTAHIERERILDKDGAAPFPGRLIHTFMTFSHLMTAEGGFIDINGISPFGNHDAFDVMPDDFNPVGEVSIELGLQQSGHAALFSPTPMRASNGEATTFVFEVNAANTGDTPDTFQITTAGVPSSWDVVVPDSVLLLDGGETVSIPVLVTTPFSHQHGAVEDFRLTMTSTSDPGSVGRLDLGVRYHEIPQPAGHHNEMWVHTGRFGDETQLSMIGDALFGAPAQAWINPVIDDPADEGIEVPFNFWGYGNHEGTGQAGRSEPHSLYQTGLWQSLEMGLDFDLDAIGTMHLPIATEAPLPSTQVSATLIHWGYDEDEQQWIQTDAAYLPPAPPIDLGPNSVTTFSWDFQPEVDADLIPYYKRAFVGFQVIVTTLQPPPPTGPQTPHIAPGGTILMPLLEYRDPVDEAFASVGQVMFHDISAQQKMVNPGETAVFEVELANHLETPAEFHLTVEGLNSQWARLVDTEHVAIDADASMPIRIAVDVPAGTADEEFVDLIVTAQHAEAPTIRTLVRLVAEVDTDDDHANESDLAGSEVEDAPSIGFMVGALALLGVALRRRK